MWHQNAVAAELTALPPWPCLGLDSRLFPLRFLLLGSCLHLWLPVDLVLAEEQHVLGLLLHALEVSPIGLPLPLPELGNHDIRLHSLCFLLQSVPEGHLG